MDPSGAALACEMDHHGWCTDTDHDYTSGGGVVALHTF